MSLGDRLAAQIARSGPISIAEYMTRCLHDPADGYYATRPALGAAGDFITAPGVSQMFGELIGLWVLETWDRLGRPSPVRLVEMGPGDGALISDLLRAARLLPVFLDAAELWLVEVSPPLRALQAERLAGAAPRWVERLEQVPEGAPMILVANEVLDCLPAHQFVRTEAGWAERVVGLDEQGRLVFGLQTIEKEPLPSADGGGAGVGVTWAVDDSRRRQAASAAITPIPNPSPIEGEGGYPLGALVESSPAQAALGAEICDRLVRDGGAALLIDYGRDTPGPGDTLQALKGHARVSPLDSPGQADLTVWADFPAVLAAARAAGAQTGPILSQAAFLGALGIAARAEALAAARPDQADKIARQLDRLTGADQMGELFKVVCLHAPGLSAPLFEAG